MVTDYQIYADWKKYIRSCSNKILSKMPKYYLMDEKYQRRPYDSRYSPTDH